MEEKKEIKENKTKQSLFARLKKVKHIEIIIAVIAVVIMVGIYFAGFGGIGSNKTTTEEDGEFYSDYCRRIQAELTQTLSKMEGAGDTRVLINWESSVELILAENQNNGTNSSSSTPIVINSSGVSRPIVTKEIYPKALGVVVVIQGGNDPKLKINIIKSVSILLNIEPDKILVYAMASR